MKDGCSTQDVVVSDLKILPSELDDSVALTISGSQTLSFRTPKRQDARSATGIQRYVVTMIG